MDSRSPGRLDSVLNKIRGKIERVEQPRQSNGSSSSSQRNQVPMVENNIEVKPIVNRNIPITLDDDEDDIEAQQNAKIKLLEKQLAEVKSTSSQQMNQMGNQIEMMFQMMKRNSEASPASSSPAQSVSSPQPAMDIDEMSDEQILQQKKMLESILLKRQQSRKSVPVKKPTSDEDLFIERVVKGSFEYPKVTIKTESPIKRKADNELPQNPPIKTPKIVDSGGGAEPLVNVHCSLCIQNFKKVSHLLNHRLEAHGKDAMLQCGKCRMKFNTRVEIQRHLYIDYAVFSCKRCSSCFPNSNQLQIHEFACSIQRQNTNNQSSESFDCNLCGNSFGNVEDLLTHRQVFHGMKIMLKCPRCNQDFLSKAMIKRHLNIEYMVYPCKNCGSCLESEEDLVEHESICGAKEMEQIVFDEDSIDSSIDTSQQNLTNPLLLLAKLENGFLKSSPSSSSASSMLDFTINSLKRKANFESDVPPIKQCSKCDKIVATIKDLLNHREEEHGIETMLVCGKCGEMFETREDIERHLNIEYRVFACSCCGLQTQNEVALKNHERLCSTRKHAKTISCWTCNDGIKFQSVTDLMTHRLIKHGKEATRECGYCNKKFETRNGIHQHLTTVEYECFKCERCSRLMLTQGKLDEHLMECNKIITKQRARNLDPGYKCSKCEHSTMIPEVLEKHEPNCRGRNIIPMQCNICHVVFDSVKTLLTHRKDTHGEDSMMECGICGRICSRRDAIALHLNIEYRVFTCLRCEKPYQTLAQVFDHEKICNGGQYHRQHHQHNQDDSILSNTATLISCPQCGRQSSSQDIIDEHLKTCIGDADWMPKLECNLCQEPFQVLNDLLTHRQKVHGTSTMYSCFKCPKQFESRKGIYGHLTLELGLLPCLKCLRNFSSVTILTNHERICGGINGGYIERSGGQSANRTTAASRLVHSCSKCGNRSGSQYIIEEHEKECLGETTQLEITCSLCYEKFTTVSDLQQHRGRLHGEESVLQCGVCNKIFESKHGVSAHLTMEYNLIPCLKCGKPQGGAPQLLEHEKNCAKNINNAMNCFKCNRLTFTKEILDAHEASCDGVITKCEKDIKCALCDEQFLNVNSLLTHLMRNHSEEAMLTCGICGRQFESKNGIWGHLNSEYEIFPCLKCGKFQNSSSRLAEHERFCISGANGEKSNGNGGGNTGMSGLDMERAALQCSKCMKTTYLTTFSRATFAQHESSCVGMGEPLDPTSRKDIMCLVCHEAYFSVGDLVTHRQRNHGEATGLECHFCGRRFESRSGIVGHLSVEYELYPCTKCGKFQSSNSRRNDHEKGCNEETFQTVNLSQCSKCQKYGHRKDEVSKHEEICGTDEYNENEKDIACIHCPDKFLNVPSLVGHNQVNHGDDAMLTCNVCGRKFDTRQGVLMHLLLEYSNHICSKCGKPQMNANKLQEHESQCTFLKTLTCSKCEMISFSDNLFDKHVNYCTGKEEEPWKLLCALCDDQKFLCVNDYLTHRNQVHGGESSMLRCSFCSKKFTSKSGISWHYNLEFALFPCQKCKKPCRSEQHQIEHEIRCNGIQFEGNESFRKNEQILQTCSKCELKTFTPTIFSQHELQCNGKIEKNIQCILCSDEKFMTVNDFLTHRQNIHGDEAVLKCQFCDRRFGSKNGVTGHMLCEFGYMECAKCNLHHYTNARLEEHMKGCNIVFGETSKSCKTCKKQSHIESVLSSHQNNCSENDTVFKCNTCSIEFISVQDLLQHKLKVHSEENMLECDICSKKFASRTGIFWHYNKEYKVYRCKKCGKPQSSANLLVDHEKNCGNVKVEKEETKTMEAFIMNCPTCGIASYYKNLMDIHKEECDKTPTLTEGGKEIYCTVCDEKYLTVNDLVTHRGKNHGEQIMLECGICQKKYESKTGVLQHYMHEFHMYPCRICKSTHASKKRRTEHEKTCKNEEVKEKEKSLEEMISCSKCNKSTYLQSIMDEHEKECSTEELDESVMEIDDSNISCPEIKCSICPVSCLSVNDLLTHRNKEHGENAMLTCVICQKVYESKTGIIGHYNLEFQQFSCKNCSKMFSHLSNLKKHSKQCQKSVGNGSFISAKDISNPSQCSKCSKWSLIPQTINEHEASCSGEIDENGKTLICTICETKWLLPYELLTHRKDQHGNSAMLECGLCERHFENRDQTLKHLYTCYELFKCKHCSKIMQSRSKLAQHLEKCAPKVKKSTRKSSTAEIPMDETTFGESECEKCQLISLDPVVLSEHEKICEGQTEWFDDDNKTITCTNCNKKFLTVNDLLSHYKGKHGETLSDCHFCGKRIDSQPGILAHFNIEYKLFECSKCDKACASKKRRDVHELSCNIKKTLSSRPKEDPLLSNDDGSFTCVKCDRRAFNGKYLKEHRTECLGSGKYTGPKIDCSCCDAKYLSVADLLQHRQKIHGNEEMLRCGVCGKKSTDKNLIYSHLVMEYRLFECVHCQRCFDSRVKLEEHTQKCQKLKNIEPMEVDLSDRTKLAEGFYNCMKCGRATTNLTTLRDHSELCRGEKDITVKVDCWDCNVKFISVHDLVRHRADSHPDKILFCKFCNRNFNSKSSILGHLVIEFQVFKCTSCDRAFDCQKRLDLHYPKCS